MARPVGTTKGRTMVAVSIYLPGALRNALRKEAEAKGLSLVTHIRSILVERQHGRTPATTAKGKAVRETV